mmetsp:Transcript_58584/g.107843  ORF Transcript_58584/g.107843 Transcript_58584/m.107843 type:complete len:99 (+) Transcript_58584:141-437(+)
MSALLRDFFTLKESIDLLNSGGTCHMSNLWCHLPPARSAILGGRRSQARQTAAHDHENDEENAHDAFAAIITIARNCSQNNVHHQKQKCDKYQGSSDS